ncbi:MAG: hypothetical protein AAGC64_13160 [Bacteroidota bacterium]
MDQHNFDRFFREKLDGIELIPNPKAWNEVEKQIGRKKRPVFYWVAASIVLCLLTWVTWPDQTLINQVALQQVDHPTRANKLYFTIPIAAELKDKKYAQAVTKASSKMAQKNVAIHYVGKHTNKEFASDQPFKTPEPKIKAIMTIEETPIPILAMHPSKKILAEVIEEKTKYDAVKITYIASDARVAKKLPIKSDSIGVFKKFIAFTDKIDPGEMLADIKTAKDNLLNGGLKNKKVRNAMIP